MEPVRVVWSLAGSNQGTTITGNGNSGGWLNVPNAESAVDLRYVDDLAILVTAAGATGTTPTLAVQLDLFDDVGNIVPKVGGFAAQLTGTTLSAMISIGKHAGTGQVVVSAWGRVSWVVGGTTPSFTGVEISVFGR